MREIPRKEEIDRMIDAERDDLRGWLSVEHAYEIKKRDDAKTAARSYRVTSDAKESEAQAAEMRAGELNNRIDYLRTLARGLNLGKPELP